MQVLPQNVVDYFLAPFSALAVFALPLVLIVDGCSEYIWNIGIRLHFACFGSYPRPVTTRGHQALSAIIGAMGYIGFYFFSINIVISSRCPHLAL